MTTAYTTNFQLAMPDFRTGPWHDLVNNDFKKIDQLILGSMSVVRALDWTNATAYAPGQSAFEPGNVTTWMCSVSHTSAVSGTFAADRAAHPTYWAQMISGFVPRGEWKNNTYYAVYDLAYQSTTGVFALCKTAHYSNPTGNIVNDKAYWQFIVDFSSMPLSTATVVTYNPSTSGLGVTNVQAAIDKVETQIVALNNVNITQGSDITALQNKDTAHETRMSDIENKNLSQDTSINNNTTAVAGKVSKVGDQMTGQLKITSPVVGGGILSLYSNTVANGVTITNDGTSCWIVPIKADGSGLGPRPIRITLSNGAVKFCDTGEDTTCGGAFAAVGKIYGEGVEVNSAIKGGTLNVAGTATANALNVTSSSIFGGAATFNATPTINGSLQVNGYVSTTQQIACSTGYRTKAGVSGGFGSNSFNWYWTGSQLQGYADDTSAGTVCDPRVKWNIEDFVVDAVALIKQLKPKSFRFRDVGIFTDDGKRHLGFLANDIHDVLPEAVIGELDAVTPSGSIQPVTLDWLPLVTILVEAVQDLTKRVEKLERV